MKIKDMKTTTACTDEELIALFMGYRLINDCIQSNDLYEAGNGLGEDSVENIWVLNPSEKFLELKRFGMWVTEDYYNSEKPYDEWHYEGGLKYKESWDWLMPVVEKIESLYEGNIIVKIAFNNCSISICTQYYLAHDEMVFNGIEFHKEETKIKSVWKTVVEFIKWYNSQSK